MKETANEHEPGWTAMATENLNDNEMDNRLKKRLQDVTYEKNLTDCIELVGEDSNNRGDEVCASDVWWARGMRCMQVTMSQPKGKETLLDGFKIGETHVINKELSNNELVVSCFKPAY